MPKYNPSDEEMDSLYESDTPMKKEMGSEEEANEESETPEKEEQSMAPSAVVPLKVLQSAEGEKVNEGDEIVVRVEKVYGDEAEIVYAPKKPSEGAGSSADAEIDEMNSKY